MCFAPFQWNASSCWSSISTARSLTPRRTCATASTPRSKSLNSRRFPTLPSRVLWATARPCSCGARWRWPAICTPEAVDEELFQKAYAFFLQYYRDHKLDFTYAYEGVLEALKALKQLHDQPGVKRVMAVLTNKPVRPARGICEGLGMADYFLHIYGGDSFPLKKPDPLGLRSLMEETGATPEETVMIGDSRVDMQTARNAGAWALGCAFGFGPQNLMEVPPDVVVDSAAEWMQALTPAPMAGAKH